MMPRVYLPLLCVSLAAAGAVAATRVEGSLTLDAIPQVPSGLADKLAPYLGARDASLLGWSPTGELLIATQSADASQLHLVKQAGGEQVQLTFGKDPVFHAAFSPDAASGAFVFARRVDGRDAQQLYFQRLGEAAAKQLTDGKSRSGAPVWSSAGREIAFFNNGRDGVSNDIDVVAPGAGLLPRLVVSGDAAAWYPLDWSPDDRRLLVLRCVSSTESNLYVVDVASGSKREIDSGPGKAKISGARFARDGLSVYLLSDRDAEFSRLRYVNLSSGERTVISAASAADIDEFALSRNGRYLGYVSNEAGVGRLGILDTLSHRELASPKLPAGIVDSLYFDNDGKRLAFALATANAPRDAYVLDIAANRVEAWTRSEAGRVEASKFVAPRLTRFPTFDRQDARQRQVPVFIYQPTAPGPHPVLIIFHGGPDAEFRPTFDPWIQFVVNEMGFAVVAPNVRGSAGYGKTYARLDDGELRDDSIKDAGALIVWLGLQRDYDAKRIIVAGADYGGYLALEALVNYNDRLRGAVDFAGMSDLVSFLSGAVAWRQTMSRAEYGDERDPDMRAFLRRLSPLTNDDRISHPVLVVHGRNDPQVPLSQSEQIVTRLRRRGVEVWYLQAANEGSGFTHQSNRDALLRVFATFLALH